MKDRSESNPGTEPTPATAPDDAPDLLQGARVFRPIYPSEGIIGDDDDTARLPKITIDAATCPRCNALVYVDVLQARPDP